jgi:hypothetical protein
MAADDKTLKISHPLHKKIKVKAASNGEKVSDLVERALLVELARKRIVL